MHEVDSQRIKFYSKEDMACGHELLKAEHILRKQVMSSYGDINEVLELYNIKMYFDNELYLTSWTQEEISNFKQKAFAYGKIVGQFFSTINDQNVVELYGQTIYNYIHSFWEIVNNHNLFKRISKANFISILNNEPHLIHEILAHKGMIDYYNIEIRKFLLNYSESAEILLSFYEVQEEAKSKQMFFPKSLSSDDKENIVLTYLDSNNTNLNYVRLVINSKAKNDFKISDKTRLKAKRLYESVTNKFLAEKGGIQFGVSVKFQEDIDKVRDHYRDDKGVLHHIYNLAFIKEHKSPYLLLQNFKYLFDFLDNQNRIALVSKRSQMQGLERYMGVHSQNEYRTSIVFSLSEMASLSQISGYNKITQDLGTSLEDILHFTFTHVFQEEYNFAANARFLIPSNTNSYFEKVRLLAPELESILKQFKLYVEDGCIDFELLQISSSPVSIEDIPSLNQNKYIYLKEDNIEIVNCSNLFFSDQTLLGYVEPFKEKHYMTFFDLLANEFVNFNNYEDYQKSKLDYLVEKSYITTDSDGIILLANTKRLLILKDLYENEFASFYSYPVDFQEEVLEMEREKIVFFDKSLFSKSEQSYFNYFLNKKEFTNGVDLRNSYLHGTQANPDEIQKHQYAYLTYMKLLILAILKIDDDLNISNGIS